MNYSEFLKKNDVNVNFINRFNEKNEKLVKLLNDYLNEPNIVFNDVYYFDLLDTLRDIQKLKQTSIICFDNKYRDIYFNAELFNVQTLDDFVEKICKAFNENKIKCSDVLKLDFDLADKDIYLDFMNIGKDGTNDT